MANIRDIYVSNTPMFIPELVELAAVLQNGLNNYYAETTVELVDCPDLTREPFNLAESGLCGDAILLEIGQRPTRFCLVNPQLQMKYYLKTLLKHFYSEYSKALIFGPTHGLRQSTQDFSDLFINASFSKVTEDYYYLDTNKSRFGFMDNLTQRYVYEPLTDSEPACYLHGNLFITEGKPGKVLKVYTKRSLTNFIFPMALHQVLNEKYSSLSSPANPKLIGLGGTYMTRVKETEHHVKLSCRDQSRMPGIYDNWHYHPNNLNLRLQSVAICTIIVNNMNYNYHLLSRGQQAYNLTNVHAKPLSLGEASTYYMETPNTEDYLGFFYPAMHFYRLDPLSTSITSDPARNNLSINI